MTTIVGKQGKIASSGANFPAALKFTDAGFTTAPQAGDRLIAVVWSLVGSTRVETDHPWTSLRSNNDFPDDISTATVFDEGTDAVGPRKGVTTSTFVLVKPWVAGESHSFSAYRPSDGAANITGVMMFLDRGGADIPLATLPTLKFTNTPGSNYSHPAIVGALALQPFIRMFWADPTVNGPVTANWASGHSWSDAGAPTVDAIGIRQGNNFVAAAYSGVTDDAGDIASDVVSVVGGFDRITSMTIVLAPPEPAPFLANPPSITGNAQAPGDGDPQVLNGDQGKFSGNTPMTITNQWQRQIGGSGSWIDMSAVTTLNYSPLESDVGDRLRLKVRAENTAGVTIVYSAPTEPVLTGFIPRPTGIPKMTGNFYSDERIVIVDDVLEADDSDVTWSENPTLRWQWGKSSTEVLAAPTIFGSAAVQAALGPDVGKWLTVRQIDLVTGAHTEWADPIKVVRPFSEFIDVEYLVAATNVDGDLIPGEPLSSGITFPTLRIPAAPSVDHCVVFIRNNHDDIPLTGYIIVTQDTISDKTEVNLALSNVTPNTPIPAFDPAVPPGIIGAFTHPDMDSYIEVEIPPASYLAIVERRSFDVGAVKSGDEFRWKVIPTITQP